MLEYAFLQGPDLPCQDAADIDDNGDVSALIDALYLLRYGFLDGPAPPDPGRDECGLDSTEDEIGCETLTEACE